MDVRWRGFEMRTLFLTICLVAATALGATNVKEATFDSVLANPAAYHRQRVSLVGVVVGNGPNFDFFKNASDTRDLPPASKYFYVVPNSKRGIVGPYDLHRVRVIGIVDASRHGLWGYACEIILEKIELLSPEPVASPTMPTGIFRNEGTKPVLLRLVGGNPESGDYISPKRITSLLLGSGYIKVFAVSGALIAETRITIKRDSPYYDPHNGAFYYRLTDRGIDRVLPILAKGWAKQAREEQ
jgi:hypothetical protein